MARFALGLGTVDEDDLYRALDWLLARQARIEDRLAARHLGDGELVLYDVSSSYFEGRCCPLAKLGYSRDGKRGTLQLVYGLPCDRRGRPLCVEVFSGELHDDKTLPAQLEKLKTRFGLKTVIVVCDRGIVTKTNLELMAEADGVGWISALKAPQIKKLVTDGALQLSLYIRGLRSAVLLMVADERLELPRRRVVADVRRLASLNDFDNRLLAMLKQPRLLAGSLTASLPEVDAALAEPEESAPWLGEFVRRLADAGVLEPEFALALTEAPDPLTTTKGAKQG